MVVFSPFVPFLCTLWEPCAHFFNIYSAFTDQKKKKKNSYSEIMLIYRLKPMLKFAIASIVETQ